VKPRASAWRAKASRITSSSERAPRVAARMRAASNIPTTAPFV
jgi:hypothetical protein